jgi:hypothetical protein
VSEVTLFDTHDVRVQLAGSDSQIEVRLHSKDPGPGLQIALQELDAYKQTPHASSITYVDLQSGRVVIGFSSGNKSVSEAAPSGTPPASAENNEKPNSAGPNTGTNEADATARRKGRQKEQGARTASGTQAPAPALRFR